MEANELVDTVGAGGVVTGVAGRVEQPHFLARTAIDELTSLLSCWRAWDGIVYNTSSLVTRQPLPHPQQWLLVQYETRLLNRSPPFVCHDAVNMYIKMSVMMLKLVYRI